MHIIFLVLSVSLASILFYFIYRFLVGYNISKCMEIFHHQYDVYISDGKSKKESFVQAVKIFKKCYPFNQLTEDDWKNINNAFTQLNNPKEEFLKFVLRPSKQVIKCFKQTDFFDEFLKIKNKYT